MLLPVLDEAPPVRADAERNREKVLCAAARLFAEHGVENVSMDAIAAAAGVGKGTLFRRFGDRAGLMQAVLSERDLESLRTELSATIAHEMRTPLTAIRTCATRSGPFAVTLDSRSSRS